MDTKRRIPFIYRYIYYLELSLLKKIFFFLFTRGETFVDILWIRVSYLIDMSKILQTM